MLCFVSDSTTLLRVLFEMTVLIPQTRKNSTERDDGQCRQSMFGLKTPISNCRRRNDLDDFDGIRSILSHRY